MIDKEVIVIGAGLAGCEAAWQIDVSAVRVVPRETYATVKYIDNVVL